MNENKKHNHTTSIQDRSEEMQTQTTPTAPNQIYEMHEMYDVLSHFKQKLTQVSTHVPDLMTEEELITFLRIPIVSKAKNLRHVIANLRRMHDLPCIHIAGQPLYPKEKILDWIRTKD